MLELDTAINTLDLFISETLKKYEGKLLPKSVESSLDTLKISLNHMLVSRRKHESEVLELSKSLKASRNGHSATSSKYCNLMLLNAKVLRNSIELEKENETLKKANNELLKGME
jgi:hypothetical protein